MTRTHLFRFAPFFGLMSALFVSQGCATSGKEEATPVGEVSLAVPASTPPEPVASTLPSAVPVVEAAPKPAKKKKPRPPREETRIDSHRSEFVDTGEFVVKCVVRLPDDETDHPELCRNFRIILLDDSDNEVARFRFDGEGLYRYRAEPGKTYRLKPLIASNWSFALQPTQALRAGVSAQAVFTQKQ